MLNHSTTNKTRVSMNVRGTAGVTLLEVMVALVCFTISILVIVQSTSNISLFRNVVATGSAYRDIEGNFRNAISQSLAQAMNSSLPGSICSGGQLAVSQSLGGGMGVTLARTLPALPSQTPAPAETQAALQRCRSGNIRTPVNANDFYFCVQLTGTGGSSYSNTSLAGSPLVFAEVRARILNVATGATVTGCNAYQQLLAGLSATPQQGAATFDITYALYWYSRGLPLVFKHRYGSFYAAITSG